ncbi:MAG: protease complex subunit PrcB family protein, partial [Candidatus Tectomicrobia bacterium]|nr:protease complex subunit PrcB family protein [Candidatus Tectomicrobia bacterium]
EERAQTLEVIKELRRGPEIDYADPNYISHATATPNDEFFRSQWHYPLINLPQAWDITKVYSKIRSLEFPKPVPPEIDFDKNRVVIAFMGERSTAGYAMTFNQLVLQRGHEIEIKVLLNFPPPDAILAQVVTNPYVIAIVEQGGYNTVKFVTEEGKILKLHDLEG